MKKYKHKITGNIAIETNSGKNYKVSNPKNFTIPTWIIKSSNDWEEVIEYSIGTKVLNTLTNTIYTKKEDGWYKPSEKTAYSDNTIKNSRHIYVIEYTEPLFTTEDDIDIFEGDEFFRVWNINNELKTDSYKCFASIHYNAKHMLKTVPHFSTKKAAEEYILMNKPCLSINDILKYLSSVNLKIDLIDPKFLKFVKNKL